MPIITVLHVSDLHYRSGKNKDAGFVIDAAIKAIKEQREKHDLQPDLVFFTGDLVNAAEDAGIFYQVHDTVVVPMLEAAGVGLDRFFACPGNHDVNRKSVRDEPWIETGLKDTLNSIDAVSKFVDAVDADPKRGLKPLERLEAWREYEDKLLRRHWRHSSHFAKTAALTIDSCEVGIAVLNTAWRATGEGDKERGCLSLPERAVDAAASDLSGCDLRFALYHHPVDWLLSDEQQIIPHDCTLDLTVCSSGIYIVLNQKFITQFLATRS